jgi:hypothetical protein
MHSRLRRLEQNQKIEPRELQEIVAVMEKAIQDGKEEYLKSRQEQSQGQAPSV